MRKIKILAIAVALIFSASCSDWLDVNTDPNFPSQVSPDLVFSTSIVEVGSITGGYYNLLGGFWSQYWTQSNTANQYKYIDQYEVDATDFNTQWRDMYITGLNDLQYVIKKSQESENWSVNLMATVIQCYGFQILADLYDEIPFNSALQGGKDLTPKFIKGEVVYDSLITRINKALSKPTTALTNSEIKSDLMFGGDMAKWREFANTLKLKIYMRQMYARPTIAQAGIAAMYAANEQFLTTDAKLDIFTNEIGYQNPLYASNNQGLNVGTNLRASATLFNYLQNKADSRFSKVFAPAPNGTVGQPLPQGGFNIQSPGAVDAAKVTLSNIDPIAPVYFISAAESYFLQAEAVAKGWIPGSAKTLYDNGIKAAFNQYKLDATSYISTGGVYEFTAGTFEEQQKAIIMQKWLSMIGSNGIEAFFETNRTHYPEISTISAYDASQANRLNPNYLGGALTYSMEGTTSGKFPKRLLFPKLERDSNPNVPTQVALTVKVWWDKK